MDAWLASYSLSKCADFIKCHAEDLDDVRGMSEREVTRMVAILCMRASNVKARRFEEMVVKIKAGASRTPPSSELVVAGAEPQQSQQQPERRVLLLADDVAAAREETEKANDSDDEQEDDEAVPEEWRRYADRMRSELGSRHPFRFVYSPGKGSSSETTAARPGMHGHPDIVIQCLVCCTRIKKDIKSHCNGQRHLALVDEQFGAQTRKSRKQPHSPLSVRISKRRRLRRS